jgi:hypothetical protein
LVHAGCDDDGEDGECKCRADDSCSASASGIGGAVTPPDALCCNPIPQCNAICITFDLSGEARRSVLRWSF